ncbi:hypothetical protein [Aporhodopirellula aestuarii]|uniref:Uncharacterized protein n=1 Tax=Aporhodopirellula aestuarii TaxID=2950107 RepID=A0ABT0U3B7_9BACT|nr:hypothetical protein [Aporhodopirellula aestuarii]MCM2371340.1 hypothetical protein [Aporhodopirellula aestuarii]
MSRRRAGISPSLFPFLAVLICTLGTLILLLALVAQQANDAAVAQVEQERREKLASAADKVNAPVASATLTSPVADEDDAPPAMTASAAQRLIAQEQFRVSQLVSFRNEQTAELERKRDEITQIESHMRKIKARLADLNAEVEMAMTEGENPVEVAQTDETTLVLMREEAAKLRAEIDELESSERGSKPRVVIVPHRGPNGTQRRPIYVLCTADGLEILPEGARITKAQALAATESDNPRSNPLGAALRTARMHAMQQYGDQLPPYPLLVVRPDGIYMYRVASALMKDWDDQYGYELVPSEVDLAFPGGDNVLRRNMELAIHEAAARNFHYASGRGGGGHGNGSGYGSSSVPDAYRGSPDQQPGSYAAGSYAAGQDGPGQTSSGQPSGGQPPNPGFASTGQAPRGAGTSRTPARALPTLSARDLDRQAQSNGFSLARDQQFSAMGNVFAEPPGSHGGSYGAAGSVKSQSAALNDFLAGKTPPGLEDSAQSDNPGGESGGTGSSGTDSPGSGTPDSGTPGQSDLAGTGSSAGTSSQPPPPGAQPGQMSSSAMSQSAMSQSPSQMSGVAMALSNPGQPGSPESSANGSSSESGQSSSQSPQSPQVAQKMVRREGKDWALPEAFRGMGGTEFVRPISMRCHHDRFELIEQGQVVQTFTFDQQDVYGPTLQLATAIRDRVMGWGATMQGGYWRPRLEVSVGPHAEQRFHELQTLMQGSGVDVVRRSP